MIKVHAFSLLELLIAITLLGVVAAMAIPNWHTFSDRQADELLALQVTEALTFAREEARATRKTMTLSWSDQKLIVFEDQYSDGKMHNKSQSHLVLPIKLRGTLQWHAFPFYTAAPRFFPKAWESAANGSLLYCHPNATTPAWELVINKMGRIRITKKLLSYCLS